MKREISFDPEDVTAVARAVWNDHYEFESGDYDKNQCRCIHCGGKSPQWGKWEDWPLIQHDLNCPVLIAKDLLTGTL